MASSKGEEVLQPADDKLVSLFDDAGEYYAESFYYNIAASLAMKSDKVECFDASGVLQNNPQGSVMNYVTHYTSNGQSTIVLPRSFEIVNDQMVCGSNVVNPISSAHMMQNDDVMQKTFNDHARSRGDESRGSPYDGKSARDITNKILKVAKAELDRAGNGSQVILPINTSLHWMAMVVRKNENGYTAEFANSSANQQRPLEYLEEDFKKVFGEELNITSLEGARIQKASMGCGAACLDNMFHLLGLPHRGNEGTDYELSISHAPFNPSIFIAIDDNSNPSQELLNMTNKDINTRGMAKKSLAQMYDKTLENVKNRVQFHGKIEPIIREQEPIIREQTTLNHIAIAPQQKQKSQYDILYRNQDSIYKTLNVQNQKLSPAQEQWVGFLMSSMKLPGDENERARELAAEILGKALKVAKGNDILQNKIKADYSADIKYYMDNSTNGKAINTIYNALNPQPVKPIIQGKTLDQETIRDLVYAMKNSDTCAVSKEILIDALNSDRENNRNEVRDALQRFINPNTDPETIQNIYNILNPKERKSSIVKGEVLNYDYMLDNRDQILVKLSNPKTTDREMRVLVSTMCIVGEDEETKITQDMAKNILVEAIEREKNDVQKESKNTVLSHDIINSLRPVYQGLMKYYNKLFHQDKNIDVDIHAMQTIHDVLNPTQNTRSSKIRKDQPQEQQQPSSNSKPLQNEDLLYGDDDVRKILTISLESDRRITKRVDNNGYEIYTNSETKVKNILLPEFVQTNDGVMLLCDGSRLSDILTNCNNDVLQNNSKILLPICAGKHWMSLVIEKDDHGTITGKFFNSLHSDSRTESVKEDFNKIFPNASFEQVDSPQQQNKYDCGPLCVQNLMKSALPDYEEKSAQELRELHQIAIDSAVARPDASNIDDLSDNMTQNKNIIQYKNKGQCAVKDKKHRYVNNAIV
jgi:hypothetical protein